LSDELDPGSGNSSIRSVSTMRAMVMSFLSIRSVKRPNAVSKVAFRASAAPASSGPSARSALDYECTESPDHPSNRQDVHVIERTLTEPF